MEQISRALELEKQDILKTYQNACADNERLQESVNQLGKDNKDLFSKV